MYLSYIRLKELTKMLLVKLLKGSKARFRIGDVL